MRNHVTKVVALLAGLILAMLAGVALAPTASAHSAVVSSDPAAGAQVDKGPAQVSITFNEALQQSYPVMTVVGPDGNFWHDGDPTVQGPTIMVKLRELGPAGTYSINYRVTSADGHPVGGKRTFTLTTAGNGTPGASAESSETTSDDGPPLWPFIVVAVVVLAGGLAAVLWRTRRSGTN